MRNFKIYTTSKGQRLYCTSHVTAQNHISKTLHNSETAVWAGDEFAKTADLYRVGRGVYRQYPDVEEGYWPNSEAENNILPR